MKTILSVLTAVVAMALSCFTTSCSSMGSSDTVSMLSASGFVSRTPETAKQRELYNALPPYKLHRGTVKGKVIYAYKDEKAGIAYVGDEAAYQRYQNLAVQRRIASDYRSAAEMNRDMAWGWYGMYGPYVGYGPRPYVIHHH